MNLNKLMTVLGIVGVLVSGCKTLQLTRKAEFPEFSTEAHRGGRGLMPENTIPAMKHAIDLGVTTLEMDTHISSDGKVFLAHDHYVNPLFVRDSEGKDIPESDNKKFIFYKMPYTEISKYDAGSKQNKNFPQQSNFKVAMPLLADVFDYVQDYLKSTGKKQVFYNIETKLNKGGDNTLHPDPETFVKLLVGVIEEKNMVPYTVVQSFDIRTIQIINEKYPQIKTSFLIDNNKSLEENMSELGYTPFILSPHMRLVDAELVKKAKSLGMKVIPWTVNTPEDIKRLKALGVDGIISDYPNLLVN